MEYLICNHCNHPNELKSSYLTFCEECHKKMDNNFNDWKKEHPSKSFEDYKSVISKRTIIHWEVDEPINITLKKKRLHTGLVISVIVIFCLSLIWGLQLVLETSDDIQNWAGKHIQFDNVEFDAWETLIVNKGNFQIKFPGTPKEIIENPDSSVEAPEVINYMYVSEAGDDINLDYSISYLTYPPDLINNRLINPNQVESFFEHTIDGFIEKEKGIIKSKNDIVYGLYPGKEITAGTQSGLVEIKCRMFLVENRLYLLKVTSNYQSAGNKATDVFLNSFKLLSYAQSGGY